jgi:small conductance mechanosensitive channel
MQQYFSRLENIDELIRHYLFPFSFKILGAFAIWIIGGFFIKIAQRLLRATLNRRLVDATLVNYANATSSFILKAFLILAILGVFGIETTSLSALLAATGVAIGMAWSGLLSNFAAGIFLIVLRPFKVGDTITAANITGVVREIGLFATTIDNGDNLRIFVGNNKIFSDNILNYSSNPHRALSFRIQLTPVTNPLKAIEQFSKKLSALPNLKTPVTGEITEFNPLGVIITVKTACHQLDYAYLLASGNQIVFETMQSEHYPAPDAKAVILSR